MITVRVWFSASFDSWAMAEQTTHDIHVTSRPALDYLLGVLERDNKVIAFAVYQDESRMTTRSLGCKWATKFLDPPNRVGEIDPEIKRLRIEAIAKDLPEPLAKEVLANSEVVLDMIDKWA